MRHWQWWHVLGLWLAAVLAGWLLLRSYLNVFSARAESGSGGLRAVGAPLWLPIVLLIVVIALLMVTWTWWRGRSPA